MSSITVVTVVKADLKGLQATWASIVEQRGFIEFEWVVIDGGGHPEICAFLGSLAEDWISWESGSDRGIYDAMNKATKYLRTDYCLYLNAGDTFANPTALLEALDEALDRRWNGRSGQMPIVLGGFLLSNSKGMSSKRPLPAFAIYHSLPTSHQAIIFPSDLIRLHSYNASLRICGDYELVARAYADRWPFVRIRAQIAVFNAGGASTQNKVRLLEEAARVQRAVLHMPAPLVAGSRLLRRFGLRELD